MEVPRARSNSLRINFGKKSPEPKDAEVFSFLRTTVKVTCEDLICVYRDTSEACIFVKFKTEELFHATLNRLPQTLMFVYQDGVELSVSIISAETSCKYVRLFNLPPEIEDQEIANVLTRYGKVQRLIRERYALDTGFPIWSGVRGVYIELTSELPEVLHVRNFSTRVHYVGMKRKCFVCGKMDHLKAQCPQRCKFGKDSTSKSFVDVVVNSSLAGFANSSPPDGKRSLLSPRQRVEDLQNLINVTESEQTSIAIPIVSGAQDAGEAVVIKKKNNTTMTTEPEEQWYTVIRNKRGRKKKNLTDADKQSDWSTESDDVDEVRKPVKKVLRVRKSANTTQVQHSRKNHPRLTRAVLKKINQVEAVKSSDNISIETPV